MYLLASQACARLGVSRDTLHKLIKSGALRAHKGPGITSPYKIAEEDLDAYIESRTVKPAAS